MHSIRILRFIQKESIINWRSTGTMETPEIHWMILGTDQTIAHSLRTTGTITSYIINNMEHLLYNKWNLSSYVITTCKMICLPWELTVFRDIYTFRDNDRSSLNCASMLKGGWWWKSCGRGLNGLYLNDPQDITARQGMFISC